MDKRKKGFATGLTLGLLTALVLAYAPQAFAVPIADNFGVDNVSGDEDTYVVVPVNITNAQDGPVICIIFDIAYDTSVMNVVDVQRGDLTSTWDLPDFNNFTWGIRVSIVYDGNTSNGIQNGTTGSVVLLNFSITGIPGSTSGMNLSNIQLADTGYTVGTAPAKNGIFSIPGGPEPTPTPSPAPTPPPARGGGGGGGGTIFPPYLATSTPTPSPTLTPSVTSTPTPPSTPTPVQSVAPIPTPSPSPVPLSTPKSGLLLLHLGDFGGIVFFITAYGFIFDSVAVSYLALKWSYLKIHRRTERAEWMNDLKRMIR